MKILNQFRKAKWMFVFLNKPTRVFHKDVIDEKKIVTIMSILVFIRPSLAG